MATDYPVRRPTRRCAATDRELATGEPFVSVLVDDGRGLLRRDYSAAAWSEPPDGAIGWWRTKLPDDGATPQAPREVLLGLLDEWADKPERASTRYLLALLLIRRRILKPQADSFFSGLQGEAVGEDAGLLRLVCRERDEPLEIAVSPPSAEEAPLIQQRLSELLGAA